MKWHEIFSSNFNLFPSVQMSDSFFPFLIVKKVCRLRIVIRKVVPVCTWFPWFPSVRAWMRICLRSAADARSGRESLRTCCRPCSAKASPANLCHFCLFLHLGKRWIKYAALSNLHGNNQIKVGQTNVENLSKMHKDLFKSISDFALMWNFWKNRRSYAISVI